MTDVISYATDLPVGSFCDTRVKPLAQKYSDFPKQQITLYSQPSRPERGALRNVTKRGAGCGGRLGAVRRTASDADGETVWS